MKNNSYIFVTSIYIKKINLYIFRPLNPPQRSKNNTFNNQKIYICALENFTYDLDILKSIPFTKE